MKKVKNKGTRDILRRAGGAMWTVTQIEREFGVPRSRLEYILRSRDIKETCRAGNCRLYSPAQVRQIQQELETDLRQFVRS